MASRKYTKQDANLRFWSKVAITANPDKCWNWTTGKDKDGYGQFWHNATNKRATHMAWQLTFGDTRNDLQILHKCDNPACVNPRHLFLGTQLENIQDRDKKGRGRQPKGENVATHKLTQKQIEYIRQCYSAGGITQKELARRFNVDPSAISLIVNHKRWAA